MRKFVFLFLVLALYPLGNETVARQPAAAPPAGAVGFQGPAATGQQAAAQPGLAGLDEFISAAMKDWKVPGLAIAVIRDGKIILSRGYGLRDVKKNQPVTPKTLFAIGSITKSFTVTSLGMLVDQGKLDWDKPVREYLAGFRLSDPVASERITPRDLVTHRSGLPRHDALWYNSTFSRGEMVERLRYLEPSKDLRTTFQYNNLMFMTAGYLAGELGGSTWEGFVRQKILRPLGMETTNFSVLDSQVSGDFAVPYQHVKESGKDEVDEIPFRVIDQVGPAGSINSCVEDMAHYVLFHLNKGKYGEAQILSENNAAQMQTPQMVMPTPIRYSELGHGSYGMGWFISAYRGHKYVEHGGAIDGFTALVSFMPQDKIGMAILTNLNSDKNPLPTILSYNVYDRLLGLDQVAWSQRFKEREKKGEESEAEAKKKGFTLRKSGTHPSHDLKEYAGEYEHPGYGIVRIDLEKDDLKITFNRLTSPLKHFHYDVFETPENPLNPLEKTKVMFFTDVRGDISSLSVPLEPMVKEIVFTRIPEKAMREASFLQGLAGQYELGPTTVTVSLKGENTLILIVPGQPEYELVPTRGTSFNVKELSGFTVEFKKDASGKVTEAVFYQPNGTFAAKRK
jgi:CubicO group peptidase (beta-lactamase class C family)